ncbi:hypothetical protein BTR23_07530 [Alkalihalophilus pseudofirmus]|nr:hypothetical protein BTR23_07530 [Alkalihalophilus pseudofirmus]
METILLQFLVPILTAIISYMAAINKSKRELDIVKEQCNNEIEKIRIQSENEIRKLETELEKQAELYERNAKTDMTKEFMSDFMKTPEMKGFVNKAIGQQFKNQFK